MKQDRRVFLIAFAVFCLVFGLLCVGGFFLAQNGSSANDTGISSTTFSSSGSAPAAGYTAADARNLLIVTTDGTAVQGCVVLRTDPANARVRALAVPRETVLTVNGEAIRLYEAGAAYGIARVKEALAQQLQLTLHHWAAISYDELESVIGYLGEGLILTLNEDVHYRAEDGYTLQLPGGVRSLTAAQVTGVLRYENWHDGARQRAAVQAEVLCALVNQYMIPSRTDMQADFSALIDMMESDIRIADFVAAREGLLYLASRNSGGALCAALSLEGSYSGGGSEVRFDPAPPMSQEWRTVFE